MIFNVNFKTLSNSVQIAFVGELTIYCILYCGSLFIMYI